MHREGQRPPEAKSSDVPATDDEIREKYLERAIRELNAFTRDSGEPFQSEGHGVSAGAKLDDRVTSLAVGDDDTLAFDESRAGSLNRGTRQRGAALVAHLTGNDALRPGRGR